MQALGPHHTAWGTLTVLIGVGLVYWAHVFHNHLETYSCDIADEGTEALTCQGSLRAGLETQGAGPNPVLVSTLCVWLPGK